MTGRLARAMLWTLSVASIAAFFALSFVRLVSPIELGNGEGMMMDNAIRIAHGQPLYVEPTLHFIPFVYMPMFSTVVAGLVKLFGPALWEGRLVDLIANLGLVVLMIYAVRRETRSTLAGVAAAGIYLMGHGLTRGGYDVVRPDPLMLVLSFGGLVVLRFTRTARGAVASGVVMGLAFIAKQHGLIFAGTALAYLLFHDRRRLVPYALALAAVAGGGFLVLSLWLGPWFRFYVLEVPSHWSEFSRGRVIAYLGEIVTGKLAALSVPTAMAMALPAMSRKRGPEWIWYWMAVGGLGTGLLATLDPYAYYHVLMPTIAAFAVAGAVALHRLSLRLGASIDGMVGGLPAVACVVLALQFIPLLYPMRTLLPRGGAHATYEETIAKLRSIPGPVMIPYHGFYAWMAGKGMHMTMLPLDDILRSHGNSLLRRDPHHFDRMFDSLRTGPDRPTIVSDTAFAKAGDASRALWESLESAYRKEGDMGDLAERLKPLAGARNAPTYIFVPRNPATDSVARDSTAVSAGPIASAPKALRPRHP